ncbi:putative HAD superfamily hydrolase [Saccharata proteae CBS 121410]|uniref:HAD superfamily hydrolase n=1 Tax=Saccharata proteae CBS 121410 TaxID=1314787 RepID=A0A9P4LYB2_9PEZI|nr:putative HAD superfamily hydrolase [Saccharata proteae CBS 121410]
MSAVATPSSLLRCIARSRPLWSTSYRAAAARPFSFCAPRQFKKPGSLPQRTPDFAFAFDIDGVLLRSSTPIPGASDALRYLQDQRIPFILLTNGGGITERERVDVLQDRLHVPLGLENFVQSHTPFAGMDEYKDKTVLVVGGDGRKCANVAKSYGFKNVVTPSDLLSACPELWPFSQNFLDYHRSSAEEMPKDALRDLKIDAVFVYNDPRDWGLDAQIITDVLLSKNGILGTISPKNGNPELPNRGYQQDGQPPLYFSNPDLIWAAKYHLPRLGQGAFREALEGVWAAITGGRSKGVELKKTVIGKPYELTYKFAENKLTQYRKLTSGGDTAALEPLKTVYMVGDNPESDIRGANDYKSPAGTDWHSILVRTGVYQDGTEPSQKPRVIVDNVMEAVRYAVERSGKGQV